MMATREQTFAVAARSFVVFLLLLLFAAASIRGARSSAETDVAVSHFSTSTSATGGPHGRLAAAVSTSEVGTREILIDGEVRPLDAACFAVCCWQGDPACPYPYCNYNQGPCNGEQ